MLVIVATGLKDRDPCPQLGCDGIVAVYKDKSKGGRRTYNCLKCNVTLPC